MYNGNAKQGFVLDTVCSIYERRGFETILEQYKSVEQELGKDLSNFSFEEHCGVIEPLFAKRYTTAIWWMGFYMIRKYLRWCVAHNIEGAVDNLDGYIPQDVGSYRNAFLSGPEELQERMDAVLAPEERVEPDIVVRAFLWILFMGVPIDNAVELNEADVDLVNLRINVGEKTFPIHPLALSTIIKAAQTKTFTLIHTYYTATVPRYESQRLLRNRRSDPTYNTLRLPLLKAIRRAGKEEGWLSPKDVFRSGYFYRALRNERQGKSADFTSYILLENNTLSGRVLNSACRDRNGYYCKWKLVNNYL